MVLLAQPLLTPRLRIEPVTPRLAAAARAGGAAFSQALGADAPPDWTTASLPLVARGAPASGWAVAAPPVRAVAIHREEGTVVGDVRFEPSRRHGGDIEIGYAIASSRRRQGYASEAAGAVIDWLFDEAGEQRLVAGCDRRNRASIMTLRRLGFWLDGSAGGAFWWLIDPDLRAAASA